MSEGKIKKVKEFVGVYKERCDCNNVADWFFMSGRESEQNYFCEHCVPRGCSCEWTFASRDAYGPTPLSEDILPNGIEGKDWKWIERGEDEEYGEVKKGEIWVYIDVNGKEYPCCEFMYSEDGWDKE